MNDIMKNIKRLRQKRGLTQEELAGKLHVTRQAVSNWETGKNQPDIELLKSLAETLEVDVTELLYAPKPDVERQKRIITAAVFCVLAAVFWAAFILLYDKARAIQSARYDTRLTMFLVLGLRPLAFCLTGGAIPALVSLWRDLHPAALSVRRRLLAAGAAILLVYLAGVWDMFHIPKLSYYWTLWAGYAPWTFLLPGALLFCGSGRKAG